MEFTAAQDGLRVDVFLAGCLPELTRSAVQRLLAEGGVTCGGAPVRKNARTEAGCTPMTARRAILPHRSTGRCLN